MSPACYRPEITIRTTVVPPLRYLVALQAAVCFSTLDRLEWCTACNHWCSVAVPKHPKAVRTEDILGQRGLLLKDDEVVWAQKDFEGRYANCFRIGLNAFEVIIDFGHRSPEGPVVLHTRIITNTSDGNTLATLLTNALRENQGYPE